MNDNPQLPSKPYVFGILYAGLKMGNQNALEEVQKLWDTYGRNRINDYVSWDEEIDPKELVSYRLRGGPCPRAIRIQSFPIVQN